MKVNQELVLLALESNIHIDTGYMSQMSAAAGYIYLNDPVKANVEIARFDIFYSKTSTGGADINFFQTRKASPRYVNEEKL